MLFVPLVIDLVFDFKDLSLSKQTFSLGDHLWRRRITFHVIDLVGMTVVCRWAPDQWPEARGLYWAVIVGILLRTAAWLLWWFGIRPLGGNSRRQFRMSLGPHADRWDRKKTMIVSDLLRAALLLLLLAVRSPEWLWAIYLVVFVQSSVGQFFNPAKGALTPQLVDEPSPFGRHVGEIGGARDRQRSRGRHRRAGFARVGVALGRDARWSALVMSR